MTELKHKIPRYLKNKSNFTFWYSIINETKFLIDLSKVRNIVDFGSGDGSFLELFNFLHQDIICNCIGVEIQDELIRYSNYNNKLSNVKFINYESFKEIEDLSQDIIFSQEVVYTVENLDAHALEIYKKLNKGGYYIFTIGCHIDNPTWIKRKKRITKEEKYNAYDYSLNQVASIFYKVGFRIGIKKIPIYYPLVFDFSQQNEFETIEELIESSQNHKYLFILLKPKYDKE
ncbi:methyltransferase domain-containing protein [Acinetobacter bereziniae]|uniref:methyltransferase domain-containing protein n=1 Tax=Acinetobacter bereziniae TaxID=106648 RepID=UPI003212A195